MASRLTSSLQRVLSPTFFTSRPPPSIPLRVSTSVRCNPQNSSKTTSRRAMSTLSAANIYADEAPPAASIKTVSNSSIELVDGLILPSACVLVEGRVFLWEVPPITGHTKWLGWSIDHFKLFEVIVPRPEILLLGSGEHAMMPPPEIRTYLNSLGIQLDVMNTWNASSTFNLLSEEGRRVSAALIPASHVPWQQSK